MYHSEMSLSTQFSFHKVIYTDKIKFMVMVYMSIKVLCSHHKFLKIMLNAFSLKIIFIIQTIVSSSFLQNKTAKEAAYLQRRKEFCRRKSPFAIIITYMSHLLGYFFWITFSACFSPNSNFSTKYFF